MSSFLDSQESSGQESKENFLNADVEPQLVVQMGENFPSALKRLWTWAKDVLTDGRTVSFESSKEACGFTTKQVVYLSDIHEICPVGEMAGSISSNLTKYFFFS